MPGVDGEAGPDQADRLGGGDPARAGPAWPGSSGLYEFRLRWSAEEVRRKVDGVSADGTARPEKILLRVFFCTSSGKIILLLSGYDKAKDPGQRRQGREITQARKLLATHQEAERRRRRASGPDGKRS